ncbi:radical SAM family heme chaperone HemW [Zavarzinella formosa]|uniref:radical SAM family heme chaperone HemW n=1 Tax=Zavarzinella formosa TaxID=360055 RepID=UPI0003142882|nr:radical SAM family heme chaperone HemW [Zavarzinella formosa]
MANTPSPSTDQLTPDRSAPWLEPRGLYVHVPFCAHHCGYCDFAVTVGQDHLIETYLEALALEIDRTEVTTPVDTIFIGGGTPTLLSPDQLGRLAGMIRRHFPTRPNLEFSIESTPESITADKVAVLADHGLNRFSLGVQSFQGHTLRVLERQHSGDQVTPAVEIIRRRVPNFSMDFIFGAPGQTITDWEHDLKRAIALGSSHISTYGLTYEKGTPLWKQRESGDVIALGETDELALYTMSHELLGSAGFEHYEISNFAKPDHRCQHNEKYWANEAYHGVGVGAVRYVGGRREHNKRNTKDYIRVVFSGESPTFQQEELSPFERARETLAVQLRRSDGVSRQAFLHQTGHSLKSIVQHRLAPMIEAGLVTDENECVSLTFAGKCVADGLVSKVVWG